jgi:hypothetical protein
MFSVLANIAIAIFRETNFLEWGGVISPYIHLAIGGGREVKA